MNAPQIQGVSGTLPLSLQIYQAQIKWADKEREFDAIDSQAEVLRERRVCELVDSGKAISRAVSIVKASEWWESYQRGWVIARHEKNLAKAKHAYLVNLAQEQRDEGFNERIAAKL